ATPLLLFVVRTGLQTGLDDPAQNVLGTALPAQVGPKLAFLLNNVVLPGAAVVSGLGLLLVQRINSSSLEFLAVVGMITACFFILVALSVRVRYVGAISQRLRSHAISLGDLQQAIGTPNQEQIAELQAFIREGDERTSQFAAAALGKLAPAAFTVMVPELLRSPNPFLRRLAF